MSKSIGLLPKHIFGLRSDVAGNVHFKSGREIIYAAAGVLVIQDIFTNEQKYLRFPENFSPDAIVISPNRQLLAVSEVNIETDVTSIVIYDLENLTKLKSLSLPAECSVQAVSSLCFTSNSKGIAILSKEPEAFITIFTFGKNETTVSGRASDTTESGLATFLHCNPGDVSIVAIGGKNTIKLMNITEKGFAPMGTNKGGSINVTSLAWLTPEILIVGSAAMELYFVEGGELKAKYNTTDLDVIDLDVPQDDDEEVSSSNSSTSSSAKKIHPVKCLTTFTKGFAFAINNTVHVFQRVTPFRFEKKTLLTIPVTLFDEPMYVIKHIAINGDQDTIVVTAHHCQIFIGPLFVPETSSIAQIDLKFLSEPLHVESIIDMSVCLWKPIVMTISKDHTVRIWNYETMKVELLKKFFMDIRSVALHPSSMFAAIGFTDALRFVQIQLKDLNSIKSFNLSMCSVLKFSYSGHLLAAGCEKFIAIVSVFEMQTVMNLKGHKGVLSLNWSADDKTLVSSGREGSTYVWDMRAGGERVSEFVEKKVIHQSVALSSNKSCTIAVSRSGFVREIRESQIFREFRSPNVESSFTSMALSKSDHFLFASNNCGSLYSVQMPFSAADGGSFMNFRCHHKAINRLSVTHNEKLLISASEDGTLVFWTITNVESQVAHPEMGKFEDVVISRRELLAINAQIEMLEMRNAEQVAEFLYEKQHGDSFHSERMRDIHMNYCKELEELKRQNEAIQEQNVYELNELKVQLLKSDEAYERKLEQVEATFANQIITEDKILQDLQMKMKRMRDSYENRLEQFSSKLQVTIEPIEKNYKVQLDDKQNKANGMLEELEEKVKEFDEHRRQVENDHNQSLVELQLGYEKRLKTSDELITHWRLNGGVLKKTISNVDKESKDIRKEIDLKKLQFTHLENVIKQNKTKIDELKQEMNVRDNVIREKKKQLAAMGKRADELEKYKQAMTHEMYEMKNDIEPREIENRQQQEIINDIQRKLKVLGDQMEEDKSRLSKLRNKLIQCEKELKTERKKSKCSRDKLAKIHRHIHNVSGFIQRPEKLKQEIISLTRRYANDSELMKKIQHDKAVETEFLKQQNYRRNEAKKLSSQIYSKAAPTCEGNDQTKAGLINENVKLIDELNQLRDQVKEKNNSNERMNLLMRTSSQSVAQQKISKISSHEIEASYKPVISELEEKLNLLVLENQNLQSQIAK